MVLKAFRDSKKPSLVQPSASASSAGSVCAAIWGWGLYLVWQGLDSPHDARIPSDSSTLDCSMSFF